MNVEQIRAAIKSAHPTWDVGDIKEAEHGIATKTYEASVDSRYIIIKPMDAWRIRKARRCYDLLAGKVPVPEVIAYTDEFIVLEKVGTGNVVEEFSKLSSEQQAELMYDIGVNIGKMHTIKFDEVGYVHPDGISGKNRMYAPPFSSWKDYIAQTYVPKLEEAEKYFKGVENYFTAKLPLLKSYLVENLGKLDVPITPCFVHDDISADNIVVKEGKMGALVDMDRSLAGHNEYDIRYARWCLTDPEVLGAIDREALYNKFLEGYMTVCGLDEGHEGRAKIYDVVHLARTISGYEYMKNNVPGFDSNRWYNGISARIKDFLE
ncbi:MAG: phosphotransferase family protein [Candidatus Nanoarchaeia archaeon]